MDIDALLEVDEEFTELSEEQIDALAAVSDDVNRGGILFYDLETVPDEYRFPPPKVGAYSGISGELAVLIEQNIGPIEKAIPDGTDEELMMLRTLESQREKPRKGVLKAIDDTLRNRSEAFEKWVKNHSVNPYTCRICAFAWSIGDGDTHCLTAADDESESKLLQAFWSLLAGDRIRCGFGITRFDDHVIASRTIRHRIENARRLNCSKYGNREAIDLEQLIFPHGNVQKCKSVAEAWGIEIPCPEMDGSQVYDLFAAEEFERIAEYARSDVHVEREMYRVASRVFSSGR